MRGFYTEPAQPESGWPLIRSWPLGLASLPSGSLGGGGPHPLRGMAGGGAPTLSDQRRKARGDVRTGLVEMVEWLSVAGRRGWHQGQGAPDPPPGWRPPSGPRSRSSRPSYCRWKNGSKSANTSSTGNWDQAPIPDGTAGPCRPAPRDPGPAEPVRRGRRRDCRSTRDAEQDRGRIRTRSV